MSLQESFLTSCSNDKVLGQRIMAWQQANAVYLQNNVLFPHQAQVEYEKLVEDGSKSLIAFLGCKQVLSKLPKNEEELKQTLDEKTKLGKWCLSNIDSQTIELLVERLISLQTNNNASTQDAKEETFNPYNLLSFQIPAQVMGENTPTKSWMCKANIAQIRNQDYDEDLMILTAMAATQQSNEDTAGEVSKITDADIIDFGADEVIEFAASCGLSLSASGKCELKNNEKKSLNTMLNLLKKSYSCDLNKLAKYLMMVLINYIRPVEEKQESLAFRVALGLSLQAIELPRNSGAFILSKFEHGSVRFYETELKRLIASQSCFKSRSLVKGNDTKEFDWLNLQRRYADFQSKNQEFKQKLLNNTDAALADVAASNASNSSLSADGLGSQITLSVDATSSEGAALGAGADGIDISKLPAGVFSDRELDVIHEFIKAAKSSEVEFSKRYHNLCFINWPNRLEQLLDTKEAIKQRKKKLSDRTIKLLEDVFTRQQQEHNVLNPETGNQQELAFKEAEDHTSPLSTEDYNTLGLADTKPNKLQDEERQQLDLFFNEHRTSLAEDPKLYEEWEALLCQQKVECNDFVLGFSKLLVGLASDQAELLKLEIVFKDFKSSEAFLKKYNQEFCAYFSIMYGPLFRSLQEKFPDWFEFKIPSLDSDFNPFIDFSKFLDKARGDDHKLNNPKRNKDNLEFKFDVNLLLQREDGSVLKHSGTVVWKMAINSVGFELSHDLDQIINAQSPLFSLLVRNIVSAQGNVQNLSLSSVEGLRADPNLILGSFIPEVEAYLPGFAQTNQLDLNALDSANAQTSGSALSLKSLAKDASGLNAAALQSVRIDVFRDLSQQFAQNCPKSKQTTETDEFDFDFDDLFEEQDQEQNSSVSLQDDFIALSQLYVQAITKMRAGELSLPIMKKLYDQYAMLQVKIMQQSTDNAKLKAMLNIVLSIGLAYEYRDKSHNQNYDVVEFAVATPYHVQSMYNHMVQISRLVNLIESMFTQKIFITKRHCLLDALSAMQDIPSGPEVVVPKYPKAGESYVLQAIESKFGYTLYRTVFSVLAKSHKYNQVHSQLSNPYCSSSFSNPKEQAETVVKYLKNYARTYPQVLERFNVVLYELTDLDVLYALYMTIQRDDFFSHFKLYLYIFNRNQTELSFIYNHFEKKCCADRDEYEAMVNDGRVQLIMLSPDDLLQMQQNVEVLKKELTAKLAKTSESNLLGKGNQLVDDAHNCLFHVGVLLHACDSQADFKFIEQKLPVSKIDSDLFHADVNFASVQEHTDVSNMFLVSAEQNLGGLIYLHALLFLTYEGNQQEICKLGEYLQAEIKGEQKQPITELITTPVPSFHLTIDSQSNSNIQQKLKDLHRYAQEVLTLDSLLTRTQLENLNIKLVKYQQSPNSNTNVFISTIFGMSQSQQHLSQILSDMQLDNSTTNCTCILNQSLQLSGGLIQHSKLSKVCTSEVLGLVLSKYLSGFILQLLNNPSGMVKMLSQDQALSEALNAPIIKAKLQAFQQQAGLKKANTAFFMLDEYASWFGSKNGERSDILALSVCKQGNSERFLLRIMIIESKFYSNLTPNTSKKSLSQTQNTAEMFFELFSHDNAMCTVDRQLRLRQLKNMLASHPVMSKIEGAMKFQQDLLLGNVDISLHAISFVYAYADSELADKEEMQVKCFNYGNTNSNTLPHAHVGMQVIFYDKATRAVVDNLLKSNPQLNLPTAKESTVATMKMLLANVNLIDFICSQIIVALDAQPAEQYKRKARIKDANAATGGKTKSTKSRKSTNADGKAATTDKADTSEQSSSQTSTLSTQDAQAAKDANVSDKVNLALEDELDDAIYGEDQDDKIIMSNVDDDEDEEGVELSIDELKLLGNQVKTDASKVNDKPQGFISSIVDGVSDHVHEGKSQQELQQFLATHPNFSQLIDSMPDSYEQQLNERQEWAKQKLDTMIHAFTELGFKPEFKECRLTPNGAIFTFKGNSKFECSPLKKKSESLMTTYGIEISDIRPGVNCINITVPTKQRIKVPYLSLCKRRQFNYKYYEDGSKGFNSKILLGIEEQNGVPAYLDLAENAPHTLIAGTTGAGKTCLITVLLLDLALTNTSKDLQMYLVDPKGGIELNAFKALPHVKEVITSKDQAIETLKNFTDTMEQRFRSFAEKQEQLGGYRSISKLSEYNDLVAPEERLPVLLLLIDEFADWFIEPEFKKKALVYINKLGAKSRAAGIHLILATQRPDCTVIDTKLRSNLGNQIAMRTRDSANSFLILNNKDYDASNLLGHGHMICSFQQTGGSALPFYAQAAFIDNALKASVLKALKEDYQNQN